MVEKLKKVFVVTQGCDMNRVDGTYFVESMGNAMITEEKSEADAILIQTCGLSPERRQAFEDEMALLAIAMPEKEIIVGGCLKAADPEAIRPYNDRINRFVSPASLAAEAERYPERNRSVPWTTKIPGSSTSVVRISTGCLEQCAYCAIWKATGKTRSRPADDIIRDIHLLIASGETKIRLTSEDCGAWGKDHGSSLRELLENLRHVNVSSAQITLGNVHPRWLPELLPDFISAVEFGVLQPVLQVPIQSGSPRILKLMKREYDVPAVFAGLKLLRQRIANIQLFTDVLVGFPTETEDDLAATIAFLKEVRFTEASIFGFNPQVGTEGATLPGKLSREILSQRVKLVVDQLLLQDYLSIAFLPWVEYVDGLARRSRPRPALYQGTWLSDTPASQGEEEMKQIIGKIEKMQNVMSNPSFAARAAKQNNELGQFAREWTQTHSKLVEAISITAVQLPSD